MCGSCSHSEVMTAVLWSLVIVLFFLTKTLLQRTLRLSYHWFSGCPEEAAGPGGRTWDLYSSCCQWAWSDGQEWVWSGLPAPCGREIHALFHQHLHLCACWPRSDLTFLYCLNLETYKNWSILQFWPKNILCFIIFRVIFKEN